MAKYRKSPNRKGIVFLLVSAVLIVIFANLLPEIQVYIKTPEAAALVSFPADHVFHSGYNEWWYLNLHVRSVRSVDNLGQKDTGYLLSFSNILNNKGLLSSRYDKNTNSFTQRTDAGGTITTSLVSGQYLYVSYKSANGLNYATLEEKPPGADRKKVYKLTGKTDQMGTFNFTLKDRTVPSTGYTTPLLWGGNSPDCIGQISVFAASDTFYYSIPDLNITGTFTDIDGTKRTVKKGKAWMDHQWFKSSPPADWVGHYWSSLSLTESNNIYATDPHHTVGFVTQIYNTGPRYTYWVKRNANGTNSCGTGGNVAIKSYGSTNYPATWTINLKKPNGSQFMILNGTAVSSNQVFSTPIGSFFEPTANYSGTLNGLPVTGHGFFETHLTK